MKNIFLVDVDDTILDFHGVSAQALRVTFQANDLPWSKELENKFRIFNTSLWEALERKEVTRDELMRERFTWFFRRMNMDEVDGYAVNRLFIEYISTHPRYLPNAELFLRELSKLGRIFFVTNGTESIQKSRFTIVNLWEKAERVFISQRIGYDKPSKEYTEYVIANIDGFHRENAVWIGDSLSADIKAANMANIMSIWFNPQEKPQAGDIIPSYVCKNYEDILKVLRKINKNS